MSQDWYHEVSIFCRQYLQLESTLDYPQPSSLKLQEVQETLYANLFADDSIQYGPPPRYQLRVLKQLVSNIESSIDDWDQYEVSENLMNALAVHLATPIQPEAVSVQQKTYVTYNLSDLPSASPSHGPHATQPHLTLLENRSLISAAGTTGLRTWEAALHMGRYFCQNPSIIRGKRILELGAGTGYISILCARHLEAAHVVASDGSDDVIHNLPENFFLNNLQDSDLIVPMDIKWGWALVGTEEQAWNGGRPVDIVVGADVAYDSSVIPALINTIVELIDLHPDVKIYISTAKRNEKTFGAFLEACGAEGLVADEIAFAVPSRREQRGPFYADNISIKICRIWRSRSPYN